MNSNLYLLKQDFSQKPTCILFIKYKVPVAHAVLLHVSLNMYMHMYITINDCLNQLSFIYIIYLFYLF